MVKSLTITPQNLPGGKVQLTWTYLEDNLPIALTGREKVFLRYTDTSVSGSTSSSFKITNIPLTPLFDSDGNMSMPTSTVIENLVLGTEYLLQLNIDGVNSDSKKVLLKDVPVKPEIQVFSRDASLAIKLVGASKKSQYDSFSTITQLEVMYADGETLVTVLVTPSAEEDIYSTSIGLPGHITLQNGKTYEISTRSLNEVGYSDISNTVIGIPKDTPNKITSVLALSDVTHLNFQGLDIASAVGAINIFCQRPGDYDTLNKKNALTNINEGVNKIFKMTLVREEMKKNMIWLTKPNGDKELVWDSTWVLDDSVDAVPIIHNLPDKDSEDPNLVANTYDGVNYDYMFVDRNVVLGKVYRYRAFGTNNNGDGEESASSNSAMSLLQPQAPTLSRVMGNKKMTVTLASAGEYYGTTAPTSQKYAALVKDDVAAWTGVPSFDFAPLTIDHDGETKTPEVPNPNANTYSFNSANNGTTLQVRIYKVAFDSLAPAFVTTLGKHVFNSIGVLLTGLTFTAPYAPPAVAVYAIDNARQPILKNGSPAVNVVFNPIRDVSMFGGLENQADFNPVTDVRYISFTSSLQNVEIPPLYSISLSAIQPSTEFTFIVPSPLNTQPPHYVRTQILNRETGQWFTSIDSTPPQSGASRSFIAAPTTLNLVRDQSDPTKIHITFQSSATVSGNVAGAPTADVFYDIKLIDMTTNTVGDLNNHKKNIAWAAGTLTASFSNLTVGRGYLAVVIPYSTYSALQLGTTDYRFNNISIRKFYKTRTFIAAAAPQVVRDFKATAMDQKMLLSWDAPSSLNGTTLVNYEGYAIRQDPLDVPPTALLPPFPALQRPVAYATSPELMTLSNVWNSRLDGISGTNLVSFVNDSDQFSLSMAAVGKVGGKTVGTATSYDDALANADNIQVMFDNWIGEETLQGIRSPPIVNKSTFQAVDAPVNLATSSDATSITCIITKNAAADELIITLNGEVRFSTTSFSTIDAVDVDPDTAGKQVTVNGQNYTLIYSSGLFGVQQAPLATALQSQFWVTVDSGITKYNVKIPVTDGSAQTIEARFAKRVGTELAISPPAIASASAAVPPAPVTVTTFEVATNQLKLGWADPTDIGGAGSIAYAGAVANSQLKHRLKLYTHAGYNASPKQTLQTVDNLSVLSYTFSGLANYSPVNATTTSYVVEIVAFYYQQNDSAKPSESITSIFNKTVNSAIVPFRVGTAPALPTIVSTLDIAAGNKATIAYTIPSNPAYPITDIKLFNDNATVPFLTYNIGASGSPAVLAAIGTTISIPVVNGNGANQFPGFLNGRQFNIRAQAVPDYSYAQNYSDVTVSVTPRKSIVSSVVTMTNPSGDLKTHAISVNTSGSSLVGFVSLGKTQGSSALQVINQSVGAGNFSPSMSGSVTSIDHSNQTAGFSYAFANHVSDVVLFLITQDGVVNKVIPSNSTLFSV